MREHSPTQSVENIKRERLPRVRKVARFALAAGGVAVVSGLTIFSWAQISGNWNDTKDMQYLLSAEGQADRCALQDADDAQEVMNIFFGEEGGMTVEQSEAMGPVVGLEAERVRKLINTVLYDMDYDCDTPEASTSKATKGIVAGGVAGGVVVGAAGTTAYMALKPKRRESVTRTDETEEPDNV
ncbi:hypothetical protein KC973_00245 [Candidatus Saccharibacteria bacterium]|nr:hypothetical protein [Candidatus Saccharibacteria bacterium]